MMKEDETRKMTINQIALLLSSTVFTIALWVWQTGIAGSSLHGRYYVTAILMISGILMLITLFRLIVPLRSRPKRSGPAGRQIPDQPRQHYRIQFDASSYPRFNQKTSNHLPATAFSCPVCDISETGIGLVCRGIYTIGQTVQGEIIFESGRTAPINGTVIREEAGRTGLRLHCMIDPPLLMAEQRDHIVRQKAKGPQPAVSKTMLDNGAGSLPSHTPKGICRLK